MTDQQSWLPRIFRSTPVEEFFGIVVGCLKNTAELATLAGLFTFIGIRYASEEAKLFGFVMSIALSLYVVKCVYRVAIGWIPLKWKLKAYIPTLLIATAAGFLISHNLNTKLLAPIVASVVKQLEAGPVAPVLPTAPVLAENQDRPAIGTDVPKSPADQKSPAVDEPAPSAPPSADQSRSSTPEERKTN